MKPDSRPSSLSRVINTLISDNLTPSVSQGTERTIISAIGDDRQVDKDHYRALDDVEKVVEILAPYKLAAKDVEPRGSLVVAGKENKVEFGRTTQVPLIVGSCSVESESQFMELAEKLSKLGAQVMRGGAFKPRSSPYSFQGMGEDGLKIMQQAREEYGPLMTTEVMSENDVELVANYADILQIGARNMQNYKLLEAAGKDSQEKPIILKRGLSSTIEEWLLAAEYIMANGNSNIILCERGIRTFETATRFTQDIGAIAVLKEFTHLPVIIDPSHAAGDRKYVESLSLAGIAAGADGLLVEVHQNPEQSLSDAAQTIGIMDYAELKDKANYVAGVYERKII